MGTAAIGCPVERSSPVFTTQSSLNSHRNRGRLILLVRALEVGDLVIAFEVPHARGDFVDQIVVVRDQQDRALIALQRNVERVDRFQIEVVRRLVENENIGLLQHELAEEQARGFSAGEHVGALGGLVAGE